MLGDLRGGTGGGNIAQILSDFIVYLYKILKNKETTFKTISVRKRTGP